MNETPFDWTGISLKKVTLTRGESDDGLDIPGNPEIIGRRSVPTGTSECMADYIEDTFGGTELKFNQAIVIDLPEGMNNQMLDAITLSHRKDKKHAGSVSSTGWDEQGAYTRVLVFDRLSQQWISWPDPYKGKSDISRGDKFAEPRPTYNPESEVLYDWRPKVGEIYPQRIAVIGVGRGEHGVVNYHGIRVDYFPEEPKTKLEFLFSNGTRFADDRGGWTPSYGGGMKYRGRYPGSVPLNHGHPESISFPVTTKGENFRLDEQGLLHITIDQDVDISRVEVAVGDTEDTGEPNKDGHIGRLGWAKLCVYILKGHEMYQIMDMANVPPAGVLKGSPEKKIQLKKGDQIVIESRNDAAYVMGVRIQ